MARETYVWRNGQVIEKHLAEPLHSGDPTFQVISDTMGPIRSMADGRMYDSKSRYRAELAAHGCREVGNDRQERRTTSLPPVRDTLRQVYQQLRG